MDDMDNPEQEPTSVAEQGPAEELAAIQPAPGSYWATYEIVQRTPEEVRRGEAPPTSGRIR